MPKYETRVTLPEDIQQYLEPFLQAGEVTFDIDLINASNPSFVFTFEAEDMWEAHEVVSDTANEADAAYQRVGGATEFTKAELVEPDRQPPIDGGKSFTPEELEANRQKLLKHGGFGGTERVYLTAEAAHEAQVNDELEELERSTRGYLTPSAASEAQYRMDVDVWRRIADGSLEVKPGMGATLVVGSDKYPFTLSRVELFKSGPRKGTPRAVWARRDDLLGTDTFIQNLAHEEQRFISTATRGAFKDAAGSLLRVGRKSFYQAPEV